LATPSGTTLFWASLLRFLPGVALFGLNPSRLTAEKPRGPLEYMDFERSRVKAIFTKSRLARLRWQKRKAATPVERGGLI